MLLDKLRNYYGFPDETQAQFIAKKTEGLSESEQDEIADRIIEERTKRFGFPDIAVLAKYLGDAQKKKSCIRYYWSVCMECGSKYAAGLPYCPSCWTNGIKCTARRIGYGSEPDTEVIRYNKEYLSSPDETACYDCDRRRDSHCWHFGAIDWECRDYRECPCAACCSKTRKFNAQLEKQRSVLHYGSAR